MTAPARCHLRDVAAHTFVTVEARICAIDPARTDGGRDWAVITLTQDGELHEVCVYPVTYALTEHHLSVGNRVVVSAQVTQDDDGLFLAATTIHPSEGAPA